jgi:hypothetical protein
MEVEVLESFIQFFGMVGVFLQFQKKKISA